MYTQGTQSSSLISGLIRKRNRVSVCSMRTYSRELNYMCSMYKILFWIRFGRVMSLVSFIKTALQTKLEKHQRNGKYSYKQPRNSPCTMVKCTSLQTATQSSTTIIPSMQWIICIASCKICRLAIAHGVSTGLQIATKYYNDSST